MIKKLICMLLLTGSGMMMAQTPSSKTLTTVHGERITFDEKMTTPQRNAKYGNNPPEEGTVIYNITNKCQEIWNGTDWFNYCWGGKDNPSSGGSANITSYTCNTSSAGIMNKGTLITGGITQTITVTATIAGTYDIKAEANGVIFKGSGSLAVGDNNILLTAEGTPTAAGMLDFTLNTSPCTFNRLVTGNIGDGTVITRTGKIWQEKNLGAQLPPTSIDDYSAYGSLYQWGRKQDGHEVVGWTSVTGGTVTGTRGTLSSDDNPYPSGNGLFIAPPSTPLDWRSTQNNNLWQGASGTNNPCPSGFRIPTGAEFTAEIATANITGIENAYASTLKLQPAGYRHMSGALEHVGEWGYYWTADTQGDYAMRALIASSPNVPGVGVNWRSVGCSVRCIKN